jgi:hypothetical protein
VVTGKTDEVAAQASVRLVCVGLTCVRALVRLIFGWSAEAHSATLMAGRTGEGVSLASDQSVGVVTGCHCGGGHAG